MANSLLVLLINKITSNNVILFSLLGICPIILYRINLQECLSTGIMIVVIMLVSSWLNLIIYHFLLLPLNFTHMTIVLFALTTYLTIHYVKMATNHYYPSLAILFEQYPEFFYTNYAIYGTTLLNISHKLVFSDYTLSVLGSGMGYFIVLFIFMTIKERIYTIKRTSSPGRLLMEFSILALMSLVFSSIIWLR